MAVVARISSTMKALLSLRAAVPAVTCASKGNTSTDFGLLGRCLSLSFPRSTGPFIRAAPLCSCSAKPPTPTTPTPPSEDSDSHQDGQERDVDITQVNNSWMEPWEVLLDHIFGPPNKLMVQFMDPVYELLQDLEIGHNAYKALLARVQVYFNLKDYEKAKTIQGMIQNSKQRNELDFRPHFLEAILNLTLAVEKLRQGKITENGAKELIENAKESWGSYEELKEVGFGLEAPQVDE